MARIIGAIDSGKADNGEMLAPFTALPYTPHMLTLTVNPRFCDTDALGHINNTVMPVWFLEAREPILRLFSPEPDARRGGIVLVRSEIDFKAETRFGPPVTITTTVRHVGNSSFRLCHRLIQEERETAISIATMVNFDAVSRRASPIPATVREALMGHYEGADV